MAGHARVRAVFGGPVGKKLKIPLSDELLNRLGRCLVDQFVREAKKDFAKRGWSGEARDGSPPIWDSFSYKIRGERTIEVLSTFPFIEEMIEADRPRGRMKWLTQEAKENEPAKFPLTPRERELRMRQGGRVSRGERLPLIVPIETRGGTVIFRAAPLRTDDAWIHPGIARFTFVERAARAGKKRCIEILKEEAVKALVAEVGK